MSWRDIAREVHLNINSNPVNAELQISNGAVGLDRILYYIRESSHFNGMTRFDDWAGD